MLVAPGRSRIVPSTRPSRTAIGGGPGKLTLTALRCASICWTPSTGRKPSVPDSPPPPTSSVPVKPPGSLRSAPRATLPATLSAAMSIVARPPLGSRICPVEVNGPSRDWPLAR